jgi:acetolactate synthase I/II/III large subunit
MKVVDAIAEILKREGVEYLSTYPTTPIIDAAAAAGIRPVLCRQERVGVGIADGYSRTTNGRRIGVFAMQYGPGAENAFPGVATAYSDSVPTLVLPLGHQRDRAQIFPLFSSARTYASVTKWVETLNQAEQVSEVMRRAFNLLKMGRPGPVMVEIPADVAVAETGDAALSYRPVKATRPSGNPLDVAAAVRVLMQARRPVIHAGQGVLYAEACDELRELAELLQAPVMTTLEGKSAFPEDHALSLGTGGGGVMSGPVHHFLLQADVVFGVGCSFTRHGMATNIPPGKTIIHATNDERDLNKNYFADHPILGDAKLVLRQVIDGMTGLDFETAVRCGIPITTIVMNNSAMAIERHALVVSHDRYRTRDIGGDYAAMGQAMGGYAERVEKPAGIVPALERARKMNDEGKAVLLEFITSEEIAFSHRRAL